MLGKKLTRYADGVDPRIVLHEEADDWTCGPKRTNKQTNSVEHIDINDNTASETRP
jgi:hypothetical protein